MMSLKKMVVAYNFNHFVIKVDAVYLHVSKTYV